MRAGGQDGKQTTRGRAFWALVALVVTTLAAAAGVLGSAVAQSDERAGERKGPAGYGVARKAGGPSGAAAVERRIARARTRRAAAARTRNSASARADRRRSRRAHAGASDAAAVRIARRTHAGVITDPLWAPIRLHGRERVVRYLGSHSARIDRGPGKPDGLVRSMLPVRADGEPVDVALRATDRGFEGANPLVAMRAGKRLGDGVAFPRTDVTVVPVGDAGARGRAVAGRAVYPNAARDTDWIVKPLPEGIQTFAQLRSPAAPERLALRFELPEGAEIRRETEGPGGWKVVDGDRVLGRFGPPRAWDADGAPVDADADLEGNVLRIDVDHASADLRYPVMVDPPYVTDSYSWKDNTVAGTGQGQNGDYAGWVPVTSDAAKYKMFKGSSYLGHGLYAYTRTSLPYTTADFGEWRFSARGYGDAFVYEASFQKLYHDGYNTATTLYTGIYTAGKVAQAPSKTQSAGRYDYWKFDHCLVGTTLPCAVSTGAKGNMAVFGTRPDTNAQRSNFTDYMGAATVSQADNAIPTLTNEPVPSGWVKSAPGMTATMSDTGLGMQKVTVRHGAGRAWTHTAGQPASSSKATTVTCSGTHSQPCPRDVSVTFDSGDLPDGEHVLHFDGVDVLGTPGTASRTLKLDTVQPGLSVTGPLTQGRFQPNGATLKAVATDGTSGVKRVAVLVDGVEKGASTTGTLDFAIDAPHGEHTIQVVAVDNAGNERKHPLITVFVDRRNPTVGLSGTLYDNRGKAIGGEKYGLHAKGEDGTGDTPPQSGVTKLTFLVDDQQAKTPKTQACAAGGCFLEDDLELVTASLSDGVHTIKAVARDQVGNDGTSEVVTVIVDRGKPRIVPPVTHEGLPTGWTKGDTTVRSTVKAEDDGSGVKRMRLTVPGQPEQVHEFPCEGTVASRCATKDATHTFAYGLQQANEGLTTIQARAEDVLGQASDPESWTARIDRSGPTLAVRGSLKKAENTVLVSGAYDLRVDVADGTPEAPRSGAKSAEILVQKPGGQFESVRSRDRACGVEGNCTLRADWVFHTDQYAQGDHMIKVIGKDQLGHETTHEFKVTVGPRLVEPAIAGGLEDYYHYQSTPTGAGSRAHVNLASGNLVWHATPLVNPGRGLSTVMNLTYNAQARTEDLALRYGVAGDGWSVGLSGLTRINEPLDVKTADAGGPVKLVDPDGTQHVFEPSDDGNDLDTFPDRYIAPPGVQIHLRRYSRAEVAGVPVPVGPLKEPNKAWAATRPDGVTFYFDQLGMATSVQDRNGNVLQYEYETVLETTGAGCTLAPDQIVDDTLRCLRRLKGVTDSAGVLDGKPNRTVKVEYWTKEEEDAHGSSEQPGPVTGKLERLTDHAGRKHEFRYDRGGRLMRVTQGVGAAAQPDGTATERAFNFAYEGQGQRRLLDRVSDPRGQVTRFEYEAEDTLSQQQTFQGRRALWVHDRRGGRTQVLYSQRPDAPTIRATVNRPRAFEGLAANAAARPGFATLNDFDKRARLERLTDAAGTKTKLGWDTDNNVVELVEAEGVADQQATATMAYNDNGMLTESKDAVGNVSKLTYRDGEGNQLSERGNNELSGTFASNDAGEKFVSDLERLEKPEGSATPAEGDHTTRFVLDSRGNVEERCDAGARDPKTTTDKCAKTKFDARGQIEREENESGLVTTYHEFDANGLPQLEVDPRGNATPNEPNDGKWARRYDDVGNVVAETDPRGHGKGGPASDSAPFTSTITYDAFDRIVKQKLPKLSEKGLFITRSTSFDLNGNEKRHVDGNGGQTVMEYTPMDEPREHATPGVPHAGETGNAAEKTKLEYDHEGNLVLQEAPKGEQSATADDFVTRHAYNAINERTVTLRQSVRDGDPKELVTSFAYDRRGNQVGVVDAKTNAPHVATKATLAEKVKAAEDNAAIETRLRWKYVYDLANRRTDAYEAPGRANFGFRTKYRYDRNDNMVAEVGPRAFVPGPDGKLPDEARFTTIYGYDQRDQLVDVTDGKKRTTHVDRRADGKIVKHTSPLGLAEDAKAREDVPLYETVYKYDAGGDLEEHVLPRAPQQYGAANMRWRFVRNAVGDAEQIIDPRGHDEGTLKAKYTFQNRYYDTGDLWKTDRPSHWNVQPGSGNGEVSAKPVSELGNDASAPDLPKAGKDGDFAQVERQSMPGLMPKKGLTELDYDDEMRLLTVFERASLPANVRETAANECRTVDIGSHNAACTRLQRDDLGRVLIVRRPLDRRPDTPANRRSIAEQFRFDRNGNQVERENGENGITKTEFDGYDRPVVETRPGSNLGEEVTKTTYDENGNKTKIDTPRTETYDEMSYDVVDRVEWTRNAVKEKLGFDRQPRAITGEQTSYAYDADGNQTMKRSPRGHDDTGLRTGECDVATARNAPADDTKATYATKCFETTYRYDDVGQLEAEKDGFGHETTYAHDADGNVITEDRPGASSTPGGTAPRNVTQRTYDGRGKLWTETTGTSTKRTTVREYDGLGNLRRVVNPAGVGTNGLPAKTDRRTLPTSPTSESDKTDDAIKDAAWNATVYEYSEDGLMTARHLPWAEKATENGDPEDPKRYRQDFLLDDRGNVKAQDAAYQWTVSNTERCEAEKSRNTYTATTDRPGCTARYEYTHYDTGWVSSSTEPMAEDPEDRNPDGTAKYKSGGNVMCHEYDRRGLQTAWKMRKQPCTTTDTPRRTISREFYDSGTLKKRSGTALNDPTPRVYTYEYDRNRNMTEMVDHRGSDDNHATADTNDRRTTIGYDAADREIKVNETFDKGKDTLTDYDPEGHPLRRRTDGRIDTSEDKYSADGKRARFWFDPLGREVKTEIDPAGTNDPTRVITTDLHPSGQRAKRVKQTGTKTKIVEVWGFADDGRVVLNRRGQENDPGQDNLKNDTTYKYDKNGNREQDERGTHKFNSRDQHTYWKRGGRAKHKDTTVTYKLNGTGQILEKDDSAPAIAAGGKTTYWYVGEELKRSELEFDNNAYPKFESKYEYSGFGNVKKISTIDNDGDPENDSEPTEYDYDEYDRMTVSKGPDETGRTRYEHDGLDRRDSKCKNAGDDGTCATGRKTDYSYVGLSESLSRETPVSTQSAAEPEEKNRDYDYDSSMDRLGTAFKKRTDSATTAASYRSYGKDANGSVEELENEDGAPDDTGKNRYQYDPYGELEPNDKSADPTARFTSPEKGLGTDAQENPFRFEGHYYDSGVKTYDAQARPYRPDVGRFLTQDRFESSTGDFNLQSDPITQSRYAFAGGNPVNRIEWDGHEPSSSYTNGCDLKYGSDSRCGGKNRERTQQSMAAAQRNSTNMEVNSERADFTGRSTVVHTPPAFAQNSAGVRAQRDAVNDRIEQAKQAEISRKEALDDSVISPIDFIGVPKAVGTLGARGIGKLAGKGDEATDAAKHADEAADGLPPGMGACPLNSFLPGTMVTMADGSQKPIEAVEVGDLVLATDGATGETRGFPVVRLLTDRDHKRLVRLTVDGRPIVATARHSFFDVDENRWVDARDLRVGDRVRRPDGSTAVIEAVHAFTLSSVRVYNLTVAGAHTYYVGDAPILTHNAGCGGGSIPSLVGRHGEERVANHIGLAPNPGPGQATVPGTGRGGFRIPDFDPAETILTRGSVVEVKNTQKLRTTRQLRDLHAYAQNRGVPLEIFSNAPAPSKGWLAKEMKKGTIVQQPIP